MGGDGIGQVAGRRAGDGREPQALGGLQGHADDPILEAVGRVGGLVLDPHVAKAQALGKPRCPDQGRQAGAETVCRVAGCARQQVAVAPQVERALGDAFAGDRRREAPMLSYSTSNGPKQYSHTYAAISPVRCPHSLHRKPVAQPPNSPPLELIASALVFGSQQQKTPFAGVLRKAIRVRSVASASPRRSTGWNWHLARMRWLPRLQRAKSLHRSRC